MCMCMIFYIYMYSVVVNTRLSVRVLSIDRYGGITKQQLTNK